MLPIADQIDFKLKEHEPGMATQYTGFNHQKVLDHFCLGQHSLHRDYTAYPIIQRQTGHKAYALCIELEGTTHWLWAGDYALELEGEFITMTKTAFEAVFKIEQDE